MLVIALIALQFAQSVEPLPSGAVLRLGDPRFRADGPVRHLRFSSDGRVLHGWVAGANDAMRPITWDSVTGARLHQRDQSQPPDLPENAVPAVRLNGNRVLTAGPGRAGLVWDADTRKELARLGGHTGKVLAVAASSDGKRLATGGSNGLIRIWDAETYVPLPSPRGHTGSVRGVQFSADGTRALTTGDDRTARLWDLATGRELRAFAADSAIDINAAGTGVIVRVDGATTIRDVVTGLEIISPDHPEQSAVLLPARHQVARAAPEKSLDGRAIARVRADGPIELCETATNEVRRVFAAHHGAVHILGFTPAGTRLLTAGSDHTILVWDVRLQSLPLPDSIKRETKAAKLWTMMCTGTASEAYLAMARFAAEPPTAVKMARMRLRPAQSSDEETAATRLADTRAIELLEALGTREARAFLQELAEGDDSAWRTHEARRAVKRLRP
jgi:WD40 repeat protein